MSAVTVIEAAAVPSRPLPRPLSRSGERAVSPAAAGRLRLLLGLTGVLAALAWTAGGAAMADEPAPRSVVVAPGQSLISIAAAELPELSPQEGVVRLQLANGLSSSQVHAGQRLTVPAR